MGSARSLTIQGTGEAKQLTVAITLGNDTIDLEIDTISLGDDTINLATDTIIADHDADDHMSDRSPWRMTP